MSWAEGAGRDVLIESINQRDVPGHCLSLQGDAYATVKTIGSPRLKVQMDLYHCQVSEGDLATFNRRWLPTGPVEHLQIAGLPTRIEPDIGEIRYEFLFDLIDEVAAGAGWSGWIGCGYRPVRGTAPGATSDGLGWLHVSSNRERQAG